MDGFDIVSSIRNHLRTMAPHQRERLTAQQLELAANEIEKLRAAIVATAEQDCTISSIDGRVTVQVDGSLTFSDAGRIAIDWAATEARRQSQIAIHKTLRSILEDSRGPN